jgi:hypothetical protein
MASSIASLSKCVSPVLAEHNVGAPDKLSSSFSVSSGAALGAYKPQSVRLVSGAAFKVRAAASDSQEAVREFALRGFHAKRALKVCHF